MKERLALLGIDHLVQTVEDVDVTIAFYRDGFGMEHVTFGEGRHSLDFEHQQINLDRKKHGWMSSAGMSAPESADLGLIWEQPLNVWVKLLTATATPAETPSGSITEKIGPIVPIHRLDPDGNLVEVSDYPRNPTDASAIKGSES